MVHLKYSKCSFRKNTREDLFASSVFLATRVFQVSRGGEGAFGKGQ